MGSVLFFLYFNSGCTAMAPCHKPVPLLGGGWYYTAPGPSIPMALASTVALEIGALHRGGLGGTEGRRSKGSCDFTLPAKDSEVPAFMSAVFCCIFVRSLLGRATLVLKIFSGGGRHRAAPESPSDLSVSLLGEVNSYFWNVSSIDRGLVGSYEPAFC